MKTLYIIRGISGSGKTTLAKKIAAEENCNYYEADMYFMVGGEYKFIPAKLKLAHDYCFEQFRKDIYDGKFNHDVIVSNTFTREWEMVNYINYALEAGYRIMIITCVSEHKNVHGVSDSVIEKQKKRFESNAELIRKYSQPDAAYHETFARLEMALVEYADDGYWCRG